jgi:AraC-like DNA-binding protein
MSSVLTCSARAAGPILLVLRAAGVELGEVAKRLGIAEAVLLDTDARLPVSQVLVPLWDLAEERLNDPLVALRAAQNISRESFDVFSYIVAASATMGEAATRAVRYFRLITEGGVYELERCDRDVWWRYRPADAAMAACRQDSLFALTVVVAHVRLWLDPDFAPLEVRLPFPEFSGRAELEAFFRAPVKLGTDRCAIRFDAAEMQRPFHSADPPLASLLERYAEEALTTLPAPGRISSLVREILTRQLQDGEISLGLVAKKLAVSERSLQRKLSAENTTLKQIAEELRRELAIRYLGRHDLAVSEVAYMLGFSETAPFFRAFKKWTGSTPGDFRRASRSGTPQRKAEQS